MTKFLRINLSYIFATTAHCSATPWLNVACFAPLVTKIQEFWSNWAAYIPIYVSFFKKKIIMIFVAEAQDGDVPAS